MLTDYTSWLHTLPLWSQPVVETFNPCFAVLLLLMIRHRVKLHRLGQPYARHKTKPAEYLGLAAAFAGLYYVHHRYPLAAQLLTWPDRFPMWHDHGGAMTLGFCAAGYGAMALSSLFAALFLRGGNRPYNGGALAGFQPAAPAYIARVWHRSTRTTYEEE